jgi:hypothetical protein
MRRRTHVVGKLRHVFLLPHLYAVHRTHACTHARMHARTHARTHKIDSRQ